MQKKGIGCVAINSNDYDAYPADSFENMQKVSKRYGFSFPYLKDGKLDVAKKYESVCTPDFFGFNRELELQYRGRFDSTGRAEKTPIDNKKDLYDAMKLISSTQKGPEMQFSSIGC